MKVKLLVEGSVEAFEKLVEEFIKNKTVISMSFSQGRLDFSVLILYMDN